MLITLLCDIPAGCAFCGEPFRRGQGGAEIWRSTTGECFCSEFCMLRGDLANARRKFLQAYEREPENPLIVNNLKLLDSSQKLIRRVPDRRGVAPD